MAHNVLSGNVYAWASCHPTYTEAGIASFAKFCMSLGSPGIFVLIGMIMAAQNIEVFGVDLLIGTALAWLILKASPAPLEEGPSGYRRTVAVPVGVWVLTVVCAILFTGNVDFSPAEKVRRADWELRMGVVHGSSEGEIGEQALYGNLETGRYSPYHPPAPDASETGADPQLWMSSTDGVCSARPSEADPQPINIGPTPGVFGVDPQLQAVASGTGQNFIYINAGARSQPQVLEREPQHANPVVPMAPGFRIAKTFSNMLVFAFQTALLTVVLWFLEFRARRADREETKREEYKRQRSVEWARARAVEAAAFPDFGPGAGMPGSGAVVAPEMGLAGGLLAAVSEPPGPGRSEETEKEAGGPLPKQGVPPAVPRSYVFRRIPEEPHWRRSLKRLFRRD
jgi:hypothetical protein